MPTPQEMIVEGHRLLQAGEFKEAGRILQLALRQAPQQGAGWLLFGMALHELKKYPESEAAIIQALELKQVTTLAYNQLGKAVHAQGRVSEALNCFIEGLKLDPSHSVAQRLYAHELYWNGRIDEALHLYETLIKYEPEDAELHVNYGVALLLNGDLQRGWQHYAWRLKTKQVRKPNCWQPQWTGESLDNRTLLVTAEQGLGDTIQFIRYATQLKQRYQCQVLALLPAHIIPILQSAPGIDGFIPEKEVLPMFDFYSPLIELPRLLQEDPRQVRWQVPYLTTSTSLRDKYAQELQNFPGMKIGLSWQGNKDNPADIFRSVPLVSMKPLFQLPNVHWFSLQQGAGCEQIAPLAQEMPIITNKHGLDAPEAAFVGTAALMQNLDLVITIDSAIAHVAGAFGIPTFLALGPVPDWRWGLHVERSYWYPHTQLFRRQNQEDWSQVFSRMAQTIASKRIQS